MDERLKERLRSRGWAEEELDKATNIMHSEEKRLKHIQYDVSMNFVVYWTVLLVLTLANFVVSILLVPFLLILKPFLLELIVAVLGLIFGLLFNLVTRDIEHIETKHHLTAAVFIPAVGIINIFVVVSVANSIATKIKIPLVQNPVFTSIVYATFFLLPYGYSSFREFLKRRKKEISA